METGASEFLAKAEKSEIGAKQEGTKESNGAEPLFNPVSPHAGAYLSARFAQSRHDWKQANGFLDQLITAGISEPNVLRRGMILSMGAGDVERAISLAHRIVKTDPDSRNSVAQVFLVIEAVNRGQYDMAAERLVKTPQDDMTAFIGPVLEGWIKAGQGKLEVARLRENPLQLYHAVLMAAYLKNEVELKKLLERFAGSDGVSIADSERLGDLYAYTGDQAKAMAFYHTVLKEWPHDRDVSEKISRLKEGKGQENFAGAKDPKHGLALAFFDIAKVLFQEKNDESARVLSSMAMYLNPDIAEARFLLGYIAQRHERYEEAIAHFSEVEEGSKFYSDARRNIADCYEGAGDFARAQAILKELAEKNGDLEAQIKVGDIYRRQDQFAKAVEAYDKAEVMLGGTVTKKYWHLLYMRGMSHEQNGDWEKAEKDLLASLKFEPEHPYILNYLGYAWADRGMNLGEALGMVRKASALRPDDGYITDSLGWVLYRMGQYKDAVPELERAVSLLPYDPVINDHLGDAYWRVGRVMEARFQWTRAKNHSEEEKLRLEIGEKLVSGLPDEPGLASLGEEKAGATSADLKQE